MSRFTATHKINSRWRNNDFVGEAGSSHTFPDAFHEEFLEDWAFQIANGDIIITETPTTGNIQMASLTVGNIVLTGSATGNFGDTGGGTTVIGTSPISVATSGSTATVSLNASYQTAGTYVTSVTGTAPITASGTTAVTVGIDQTAITANSATNAEVIRTYVKNTSGSAMTKGQAVYVNGADGTNVTIQLSTASTEAGSSKTLGLLAQDLANNAFGYVIENGLLTGIDTSAATAGQTVWLSNTAGGRVYGAPPAEPSHSVYLGVVARSNANNGEILVKVQNGYELDELHDVSAASPSDGDIIQYKTSSSLWTKASIAGAGIAASSHTHNYQPFGTYLTALTATAPISASTDTAGVVTVSLTANYQTAGTYITAVSGSAPIAVTTNSAGVSTVSLTATYDSAGTAASAVSTHAAVTTSVHGITNTANLLTTSSAFVDISNATATATTISSTTATAPTDISGMTFTFTPTYNEDVILQANIVITQSSAPGAVVDLIGKITVNGTQAAPFAFTRLTASHGSPSGFTESIVHTFAAVSGTPYTAKVSVYKSAAQGTYSVSNGSSFSIMRVRS